MMNTHPHIAAYFLSVVVGAPVTWAFTTFLFWRLNERLGEKPEVERVWWIPVLTGIAERAVVTTLIIWTPKLLAGFIAGWVALKVAGGWGRLKDATTRNLATIALGTLGTTISLAWAIAFTVYFFPCAISSLSKPN